MWAMPGEDGGLRHIRWYRTRRTGEGLAAAGNGTPTRAQARLDTPTADDQDWRALTCTRGFVTASGRRYSRAIAPGPATAGCGARCLRSARLRSG